MARASPSSLGFSSFTSAMTLSSSSIKSWESQTVTTPTQQHTGRRSFIISSGETMRQPTGSSSKPPPSGVFTQDSFKHSIQLEEDGLAPVAGTPPGKDNPALAPGTPPGKCCVASASEADPRTSTRTIEQGREPEREIVTIVRQPSRNVDCQRPISEYLWLGTIPDDETEIQRLACWAKGYLIHNSELYHCSA
jgi:hypothetical protein